MRADLVARHLLPFRARPSGLIAISSMERSMLLYMATCKVVCEQSKSRGPSRGSVLCRVSTSPGARTCTLAQTRPTCVDALPRVHRALHVC